MELKDQLEALYKKTREKCVNTMKHYGGSEENIEVRHLEKLDRIRDAQSPNEGLVLAKKAEDSVFMTALSLVAKKVLPGPNTPDLWDDKARKADSLVRWLEKEANSKYTDEEKKPKMLAQAEKQRQRAIKLREYADRLRKDPSLPPPDFKAEEKEEAPPPEPEKKPRKPKAEPPVKLKRERKLVGFKSGTRRKRTA